MNDEFKGRVLAVAGSDSGGGAGIQADIKTITALGAYAATAITALTVQDTHGVKDVFPVPVEIIRSQMKAVLGDIGADAIKTGMLATAEVIEAVAEEADAYDAPAALIVDPVMVAKGGSPLLEPSAIDALKKALFPFADIVTPNMPEAAALTGLQVESVEEQKRAGEAILEMGALAVLVKGGHGTGETVQDVLVTGETIQVMTSPRIDTRHTHGTGCTLASAIAAGLSFGLDLSEAVLQARDYVHEAIALAPGFGGGHGPLNHGFTFSQGE
jgi:hydroxymethylpyrimidine/phosphomethylpyrimidine kinase